MKNLLKRFSGERIFVVEGAVSLLLFVITIVICSLSESLPEENGIISASICVAIIMFVSIASALRKEGAEGFFFALIGSFIAGLATTMIGARLAFDPSIKSYLLSSLTLSIFLSLSGTLFTIPENIREYKPKLKDALVWAASIMLATFVNFAVIYWLPKMI